jgi:ATP adenylyltransferase
MSSQGPSPENPRPRAAPEVVIPPPRGPELLQAPWRLDYLEAIGKAEQASGVSTGSFLLDYWRDPPGDGRNHVILRTADGLILLNAFPYASGHLLVALGEPRPRLLDYTPPQRGRLWALTELAADLMERALEPQGINVGINQGRAAGAGVPSHFHIHLVPRWGGDVNFMTVVGQVRVIPSSLDAMAERYRSVVAKDRESRTGNPPK